MPREFANPLSQCLAGFFPPLFWRSARLLVAVSGGPDSVALLRGIAEIRGTSAEPLFVGHFNHGLRGQESDADEQLVVELCQKLGATCHVGRAAQRAHSELALRNERYAFLEANARQAGAPFVVTAHTADDQAETVLHRILRGTSLRGLRGILPRRKLPGGVRLIRPLLGIDRKAVLAYLAAIDQPFREDRSNRDRKFFRNRVRHELLPLLRQDYHQTTVQSLVRLAEIARSAQISIDQMVEALLEQAVQSRTENEIVLSVEALASTTQHVRCELFARLWREQGWPRAQMGQAEWTTLAVLAADPGDQSRDLPGTVRAQKKGASLWLTRLERSQRTSAE